MDNANKTRTRLGLFLGALFLLFLFILLQLFKHPETAGLLMALPSPAAFVCNLRCLGIVPTLQVLGEVGRAFLLIFISLWFLYAVSRTVQRILRTLVFIDRAVRQIVSGADIPRFLREENVAVFEDSLPLAFTGGFLKPRIFVSTKLIEVLDENELRAVVLHEFHHRKSRDPLKGLAVSFISDFLFFLPISRFLKKTHLLASEIAADAHSVQGRADPADLAASLSKVQKFSAPAASWFFDPTAERAKHLLGERSKIPLPVKRVILTIVFLAVSALVAGIPDRKSVTLMFIRHDKTCVLRADNK
jgi:Zn-dependent protease with chaperone function